MVERSNPILQKMLERLFASLVSGASMNCRPNASRQRVDFMQLAKLRDVAPAQALLGIFGEARSIHLAGHVPAPKGTAARQGRYASAPQPEESDLTAEEVAAQRAWSDQQKLLTKLRVMAEDARTYEQDTGVHALAIGYPLLSLPPGTFGSKAGVATRRILAPVAFIPVVITIKSGTKPGIEIACRGEGVDLIAPNMALLAWLEQQTGQPVENPFGDDTGEDPWREISELTRLVAERARVKGAELFESPTLPESLSLIATPTADDDEAGGAAIVPAAVIGLFPSANQGLLDDTRAMLAEGVPDSPLDSFVRHGVSLDVPPPKDPATAVAPEPAPATSKRTMTDERLVTLADPCQSRAVRLSRTARGLVIHGPPGTGKSQTIANVIGDHLAANQRVLFVSDKRTALDVVADRLRALELGNLVATVHDPQRDQRELYRSVREQLDGLADESLKPSAETKLTKIDAELQSLHDELTAYYQTLMGSNGGPGSFHHLMGQWLSETGDDASATCDWKALQALTVADFEKSGARLKETLERGEAIDYANNPWAKAAGIVLRKFLSAPMDHYRELLAGCRKVAQTTDATADPRRPAFDPTTDLTQQAAQHRDTAGRIEKLNDLPQAVAAKWAPAKPEAIDEAQASLAAIASYRELVKTAQLDPVLLAARPDAISPEKLADEAALLKRYAEAIETHAARFAKIRAAAPTADSAIILKWMTADAAVAQQARKRLTAAASIASAVESTTLDPSLHARIEATPIAPPQIVEWLGALSAYIDSSKSILGALAFGKKKAADPAVRQFGLSLSPAAAEQVRTLLTGVQNRSDLQNLLQSAVQAKFESSPDDAQLTTTYTQHLSVLNALATPDASTSVVTANVTLDPAALQALLGDSQREASTLLERFGLKPDAVSAHRLVDFLIALEARTRIVDVLKSLAPSESPTLETPAEKLLSLAQNLEAMLALFKDISGGTPLGDAVRQALIDTSACPEIVAALKRSPERAAAMLKLQKTLHDTELFAEAYEAAAYKALCRGKLLDETIAGLAERVDTLEGVLRVREGLAQLPPEIRKAATTMLADSTPAGVGYSAIRRNVLAGEIVRRLESSPELQTVDGHRLKTAFDRYGSLTETKKNVVRDVIQHRWLSRQKERLLASTGSRLNATGADLRRRLTTRGERAMRLRQVIKHGAAVEGGDPLFDLRPIWMASPETVAQLFPREAIFDVVVFDEASQCRLEEALPVLTRAHRVVIAGDPKQLPPTRFFESAVTTSEEDDVNTEQALFESTQGEVEDLLTAALGLDVHQCYLDVHYRSRNADLIGFSNDYFYGSRLQAIPGHPRNRTRYAPITLYRADGVYEKRRNRAEAERVCAIVHDLLKRAKPPSIGIACFNMVQREEVLEALDDLAEQDSDFATRLAAARERRGPGGPEGLFVKNLENVQGDERDHIIISTTYGPDAAGKFRRQFGPLGTAGGGRRLNVLVTRARQELHVVTSIPRAAYTARPEIPAGVTPGGAWLLFAYLAYIEQLHEDYETNQRVLENAAPSDRASVDSRATRNPSNFATALARKLAAEHNQSSSAPWGNEGFCIDVAMQHPRKLEDVTVGVLCDMTRYAGSDDPVEWDVFSTGVQEAQGWKLHRIWTPHFFRDPAGAMQGIMTAVKKAGGVDKAEDKPAEESPDKGK